jgi:hypothetical protein
MDTTQFDVIGVKTEASGGGMSAAEIHEPAYAGVFEPVV